jgi:hypothetical protein
MITSYVSGYITSLGERPGQVFNERSRVQTSARRPAIPTEVFRGFLRSSRQVTEQYLKLPLPSTTFLINRSLIILSFDATFSELLKSSLNKLQIKRKIITELNKFIGKKVISVDKLKNTIF